MKARILAILFGLLVSMNAVASWFGNNSGYRGGNDWPEWTPMYWMEEMMDGWDNDDDYYGYGPYGYVPNPYMMKPYQPHPYPMAPAPVAPQAALPAPTAPQTQ